MPGALDNGLHFSHDYFVRNTGLLGRHRSLDLGAKPRIIRGSVLDGRELRLDGGWVGHNHEYSARVKVSNNRYYSASHFVQLERIGNISLTQ